MADSHEYDMIVVGTGWYGLVAAKVYIEMHPTEKILVLEASGSCGGTWSEDRLYPGLKSNNLLDSYEYPDMSMANYGVKPGQHIPGTVLHKYLTDFAKKFGVFERTQFYTKVDRIEPQGKGWKLTSSANPQSPPGKSSFTTRKVILATGLTSTPNFPTYKGAETFGAPLFHAKDFCRQGHTVETAKNAVVIGGAKSAYDVAYAYVVNGCQVDLVIRPTGNGPVWISRPWVMGGGKRLDKLLQVRWMTWFSPGPWTEIGAWPRSLLHRTAIGRWIVDKFWGALAGDVVQLNGYDSHKELKKLHPWNAAFWIGSGLSIHNYDTDFFDMIKDGRIRVHIADVDHMSKKTVHLTTGEALKADVVICSTGWKKEPAIEFHNFGEAGIGLPHPKAEQKRLAADYDKKVLAMFPRLKDQPKLEFTPKEDPYRLYRFMIPPTFMKQRNIAFAGMVSTVTTSMLATIQAVWISMFLDGNLDREAKTEDEITDEIMLHTQWGKWRHPTGYGASLPDMVFDGLPFADTLLKDCGLEIKRKPSLLKEYTEPYAPPDYVGLIDEWKRKHPGLVKQ